MGQLAKYLKFITDRLDSQLPISTLNNDLHKLLTTDYIINQARLSTKPSPEKEVNYEIAYHLIKTVLQKGYHNGEQRDSWHNSVHDSNIESLLPKKIREKISLELSISEECKDLINQITVIFLEKKVQLDNKFVWGISFVWYQVLPKIFFIGEMIFTESSVIFIPTRNEFKFSILSYNEEELLRAIGSRVGGLAAHDPNYQVRQDILAATAKKEVIQRGMNILQRFNYNIDCTGESKNEGYLYIDRKFIKDIIINQGTLKIFTSETRNYSFSSLTIKLTEAECNINLRKWLDNDYDGLTSSLIVSKTIAPKVLLDGLLNKRVFSSKLIDSFLDDEKESLYFFELYKGLGHEDKQQIIKQAMIVSESLHNKLTDTQFMATIDYREQNTESNCFIATAVYEDPNSEPIQILRYFRDNILIKSCIGQTFIKQYYNCSPSIANYIANKRLFKELIKRFVLNPIIWIIRKAC